MERARNNSDILVEFMPDRLKPGLQNFQSENCSALCFPFAELTFMVLPCHPSTLFLKSVRWKSKTR